MPVPASPQHQSPTERLAPVRQVHPVHLVRPVHLALLVQDLQSLMLMQPHLDQVLLPVVALLLREELLRLAADPRLPGVVRHLQLIVRLLLLQAVLRLLVVRLRPRLHLPAEALHPLEAHLHLLLQAVVRLLRQGHHLGFLDCFVGQGVAARCSTQH